MRSNLLRKNVFSYLTLLSSLIWLTSCPKEKDPKPTEPKAEVTADAGADQSVQIGKTVTLDGSASKDSKGTALTYSWAFTARPNGSAAALTDAAKEKPTFLADVAGDYEVELTVTNANGTDKDKVKVTATGSVTSIVLDAEITADRVLTNIVADPNLPDYLANTDVRVSAKLTVQPGVVIAFAPDKGMYINNPGGVLIAKGTSGQKITFTGKDKNKGTWKGLMILSSSILNEIDFVEVAYAGSSPLTGVGVKSNLVLYGNSSTPANAKVTNSSFTNGGGYGLYAQNGAVLAAFANNTASDNTGTAAYVYADQLGMLDGASKFNGNNGYNGVQIEGETELEAPEATWPAFADGSKYLVTNDLTIKSGVKIAPGATFEFATDEGMYVQANGGYLIAKGTSGQKITFTGKDKTKGFWKGIMIYSPSIQNEIDYIEVAYAGSSSLIGVGVKANMVFYGNSSTPAKVKLTNSTFTNGAGYGLYVQSGAVLAAFANNVASNNAGTAAFVYADQLGMLDAASKFNAGNGYNGVQTEGETEAEASEVTWPSFTDGSKYLVTNDLSIKSGVIIAPGATFEFATDEGMYVQAGGGHLIAKGTAGQKITFTGKDKTKGFWKGIMVYSPSPRNEFEYTEVAYAGSTPLIGVGVKSNLVLYGNSSTPANAKVANSTFSNGSGYGLYVQDGATVNADAGTVNTYSGNTTAGFFLQ
jgi:RNase P/RNase MRP subunit p29